MRNRGAAAAFCLIAWAALASAAPPTSGVSAVGLDGYRRFHANDSLIGRPVPCTYEEKLCFRYNMVYGGKRCTQLTFDIFKQPPKSCLNTWNHLLIDGDKFLKGSGHLTLKRVDDECLKNDGYSMAFDGLCYNKTLVRDILCGCKERPTVHILGGMECRCNPFKPISVKQPEEEGRCRIPDLRFPSDRSQFSQTPFEDIQGFEIVDNQLADPKPPPRFSCTPEQGRCFSQGKVWLSEADGCFPLLERGPCAEEHVVALDGRAARNGRAEGTCVHARGGCPQGHVRMAFDGRCYSVRDLSVLAVGLIYQNQYGAFAASRALSSVAFQPVFQDARFCVVNTNPWSGGSGCGGARVPCHSSEGCKRYEVISTPPEPEF